jgi:hypothetical protein
MTGESGVALEPAVDLGPAAAAVVHRPRAANSAQVLALGCGLIVVALLLAYLFVCLWPSKFTENTTGAADQVVELLWTARVFTISADVRLLMVVMLAGGLGSFVHTATSFGDFVGNEKLSRSWLWWYILKPFIGMVLAVIFYLVIRGGFLSTGADAGKLNIYGITALAGLAGMFSKQATDKLSEVFDALFRTAAGNGDAKRKDDLGNPLPVLVDLDPTSIEPGTQNVVVTIKGSGFVRGSVVRINEANRETIFRDESRLTAKLLPEDVANEGRLEVVVVNPPPGGGTSTSLKIKVAPADVGQAKPGTGTALAEADVDGCDVEVVAATPDEALPASDGGVAAS